MTAARRDYVSWEVRSQQRAQSKLELQKRLKLVRAAPAAMTLRYDPRTYTTYFNNGVTVTDQQLISMDRTWRNAWTNPTPIYYNADAWVTLGTAVTTAANTMTRTYQAWAQTMTSTGYNTMTIDWPTYSYTDQAYWGGWNQQYTETVEAREARIAHEEEMRRRQAIVQREHRARIAAEEAEREKAEITARELLLAHLSAQQKRDLLEHGWFEVIGSVGRRWRIRTRSGYSGNIDLMPEVGEVRLASYCAHAYDQLPLHDHYLIQKIVLEADEESFIAIANVSYANPEIPAAQIPNRRYPGRHEPPAAAYPLDEGQVA